MGSEGDGDTSERVQSACAACEEWWSVCASPRLPSEYPHPLRLSAWEAFRFNVGVMRAARRWRRHEISEAHGKMEGDDFGIGMIQSLLTESLARR